MAFTPKPRLRPTRGLLFVLAMILGIAALRFTLGGHRSAGEVEAGP